jgi:DNA-binding transcriptional regulator YhcF (GntR family)
MNRETFDHVTANLVSARDLASRWRCHRATVSRILERAGIRPYCLGRLGRYGARVKRYRQDEVDAFMAARRAP